MYVCIYLFGALEVNTRTWIKKEHASIDSFAVDVFDNATDTSVWATKWKNHENF